VSPVSVHATPPGTVTDAGSEVDAAAGGAVRIVDVTSAVEARESARTHVTVCRRIECREWRGTHSFEGNAPERDFGRPTAASNTQRADQGAFRIFAIREGTSRQMTAITPMSRVSPSRFIVPPNPEETVR
jgi:hypothetical protein